MKKRALIAIALILCICLLPTAAFALEGEETPAEIPTEETGATAATLPTADENGVITLTEDVTATLTVAQNETVTLDLAGYTLTNAAGQHTIINHGTLTIQDSGATGTIQNNDAGLSALQNEPGGTVTINGGTLKKERNIGSNDYYVITNHGTKITINGGTITSTSSHSSAIENGWYTASANSGGAYSELVIMDGTVSNTAVEASGGLYTLKNDDYGKMTINGGTFTNTSPQAGAVLNWNELTITGGTFTANNASVSTMCEGDTNPRYDYETGKTTITGGEFNGFLGTNADYSKAITVSVTGGTFSDTNSVDPYGVVRIGRTYYETLAEAVKEAQTGAEITLLKDCEGSGIGLFVNTSTGKCGVKKLTIDFGSHTYTMNGTAVGSTGTESQSMHFEKGSDITLKNGILKVAGGSMGIQNYGDLKLIDFHVDASGNTNCGYALSNNCGKVEISGSSSITAATGKVAFDVCVTSNYSDGVTVTVDTTGTITGKIQYDVWTGKPAVNKAYLNIKNGKFEGAWDIEAALTDDAKANFSVTGGTFNFDPNPYVAENYQATQDESAGTWTVAAAPTTYTVTIDSGIQNGTVTADKTTDVAEGEEVTLTVTPAEGYELGTLTVTDASGNPVTVTDNKFTMPAGNVTVTATFTEEEPPAPPTPPTPSRPTTTTTTEHNEDGSTTTTKTNRITGTVTETTKMPDGSSTVVETRRDGTVTTTEKAADGSTATTVVKPDGSSQLDVRQADGTTASQTVDAEGNTQTQVAVSNNAVAAAKESGETVALPIPAVTVPAADAEDTAAPAVEIAIPMAEDKVKVEIPVENVTPGTVAVIVREDGAEEVVKTSYVTENGLVVPLEENATVKLVDNAKQFDDMADDHWARDNVAFASSRELFKGVTETAFMPDAPMTRAMLVTVLARIEGVKPESETLWYGAAMEWAVGLGVTDGTYAEDAISREQLAVMLYRYCGEPETTGDLSQFIDADNISSYAVNAIKWAAEKGILQGKGGGFLDPLGRANRAEVAAMLERFIKN